MKCALAVLVVMLSLGLSGCAKLKVAPVLQPGKDALVWPQPPEQPRYAYAGTLVGERDFVAKTDEGKSTARIVMEVITGIIFGEPNYKQLERPVSGVFDKHGRLLVADPGTATIMVFDFPLANVYTWERGSDEDDFLAPVGIAEDGKGGYYITDSDLGIVFHLNTEGEPQKPFGKDALTRPTGIARDPKSGNIYVVDTGKHQIAVFNANEELIDTIGSRGEPQGLLNYPTYIAVANNQLYVADSLNFRVQVFDMNGEGKLSLGQLGIRVGDMTRPKGVAVGRDGRIYVVESYFDHLLIYDAKGRFLMPIGGDGDGLGQFYLPAGVWTDGVDRVFVADMFNGRISVFKELTAGGAP